MKKKTITILILVSLLAAGLAGGAYYFIHAMKEAVHDSYAVWWVAGMVIDHMEANDGAWPSGWDDLKDDYATCAKRSDNPWTFEELKNRVEVDWSADPRELVETHPQFQDKPFRVVWLRDGANRYWAGHEPNTLILEYLKDHKASKSTSQPTTMSNPAEHSI